MKIWEIDFNDTSKKYKIADNGKFFCDDKIYKSNKYTLVDCNNPYEDSFIDSLNLSNILELELEEVQEKEPKYYLIHKFINWGSEIFLNKSKDTYITRYELNIKDEDEAWQTKFTKKEEFDTDFSDFEIVKAEDGLWKTK